MNGEANLTFDGSTLTATADVHVANGLVVGHTSQETISIGDGATDLVPEVQILGTAQADSSLMLAAFSTTATAAGAPLIALVKGGNATIGSHTIVTDGEELGNIIAYGDDGTDLEAAAAMISFEVDGTPGTGDMPGRILFATTTDGGETLTERMRISATGLVTLAASLNIGSVAAAGTDTDKFLVLDSSGNVDYRTGALAFGDMKVAASDSATGVVELATVAELDTGTDTGRAVTPDVLAGSNFGERIVELLAVDFTVDTAVADGLAYFHVPSSMAGMNLVEVHAEVFTAGTTNTTDIQIANVTQGADMLSTVITIDSGETGSDTAAAAAAIDTGEDDLTVNDMIRIDIDAVSSTEAKGLLVTLVFRFP